MKKIYSFFLAMFLFVGFSYANEPEQLFTMEDENLSQEFDQLNKIEAYVNANEGVTLEKLQEENSGLLDGISLNADASAGLAMDDLPGNIPAFWWGCVLSWIGLLLVYILSDQDKEHTKKALMGCLVGAGAWILFYVVLWGLALGNVAWLL